MKYLLILLMLFSFACSNSSKKASEDVSTDNDFVEVDNVEQTEQNDADDDFVVDNSIPKEKDTFYFKGKIVRSAIYSNVSKNLLFVGENDKTAFLVSVDEGKEVWRKSWVKRDWQSANDIALDEEGNVFVSGDRADDKTKSLSVAFLSMLDSSGKELWIKDFSADKNVSAYCVTVSSDAIFIGGRTLGTLATQKPIGGTDAFLIKTDFKGKVIWAKQWGSPGFDSVQDCETDRDGNVIVGGTTENSQTESVAFLRKINPAGGVVWEKNPQGRVVWSVDVDDFGAVLAGGANKTDGFVEFYSATGKKLWRQDIKTDKFTNITNVFCDNHNYFFATGSTTGALSGFVNENEGTGDSIFFKFDETGKPIWSLQFGTKKDEMGQKLAISSLDELFVFGFLNKEESENSVFLTSF